MLWKIASWNVIDWLPLLIYWPNWLTDQLNDKLTDWQIDWLTDWLTKLTDGQTDGWTDWLNGCLTYWLTDCLTGCAINGIAAQLSEELNRLTLQNKIFTKSTCMLQYENLQYKEESSIMSTTMTSQNKKRQLFINDWEIKKKWMVCMYM